MPEQSGDSFDFCVLFRVYFIGKGAVTEPPKIDVQGDVNKDGKFDDNDLVVMQNWLLAVPDAELSDWKAGDLCEDGKIDAFDMCLMRKLYLNQQSMPPVTTQSTTSTTAKL